MDWQMRGLKDGISGNISATYSNIKTQILLMSIGAYILPPVGYIATGWS